MKLACLFLTLLLWASSALAQQDERAVKVAYIYNFLRFTEWPIPLEQPFYLCVLGRTPLDDELLQLENQPVRQDTVIDVVHVAIGDDLEFCHSLYFDDAQRRQIDMLLRQLNAAPILTISDAEGFADRGVMIEMGTLRNRVVFEVNLSAAQLADMDISAQLLKLARYVAIR